MTFDLIAPESLHAWWSYVREGLERVKDRSKERWLIEDVYTCIRTKRSTLYIGRDGDKPIGFFVAEQSLENGMATALKVASAAWLISGVGLT